MFRFRRRRTAPGAAAAGSPGPDSARLDDPGPGALDEDVPGRDAGGVDAGGRDTGEAAAAGHGAVEPHAGGPHAGWQGSGEGDATGAILPDRLAAGHHGLLGDPPREAAAEAGGEASDTDVGQQSPGDAGRPGEYVPPAGAAGALEDPEAESGTDAETAADMQPQPHMTAKNLRRTLVLVAIGSLAAAAITLVSTGNLDGVFGSSQDSSDTASQHGSTRSTSSAEGPAFAGSEPGTCLTWENSEDPTIETVDCDQPHYFEVASRVDLARFPSSEFGPHAQLANPRRYAAVRDTICQPDAVRYLNGRLDPSGRFTVGLVHPGENGWSGGERTVLCGLQETGVDGTGFRPITGRVADQDQSPVHPPGTCLGIENGLPGDPVDCADDHAVEVTGQVDLGEKFPGDWPTTEDQDGFLGETCEKISEDYVGGYDALHDTTLTSYWSTVSLPSWLAGSRKVDCLLGFGKDDGAYAVLTGAVKSGLTIDGKPPEPEPMAPDGRSVRPPVPLGDSGMD